MKNVIASFLIAFFAVYTISAQNKSFNLDDASTSKLRSTSILENKSTPTFQNASKSRELVINPVIQSKELIHVNDTIILGLFSDKQYKAFVDKIDEDINGTTTIRARILNSNFGYCIISTFNGKSFMTVEVPDKNELYMSKFDQKTKKYYLLQIDKSKQKALEGAPSLIPPSNNQPTNYLPNNNLPTKNLSRFNQPINYSNLTTSQILNNPNQLTNSIIGDGSFAKSKVILGDSSYSILITPQYLINPNSLPTTKIESKNVTNSRTIISDPNTNDTITLMVVYTPAAAAWSESNETNINNTISLLMAKAQLALDNSNTLTTIKLVYTAELNYVEHNNSIDLDNLTNNGDRQMDEVHNWRDAYCADVVVLLENIDFTGGVGWLLNSPSGLPQYAFSLTRVQQASWTYSTIHEIGHNMGCHHPKLQNLQPGPGLYSYSAGWRWNGTDGIKYCDIMTYESGSYFADGINATTVPYFSNPDIQYQGVPTGDAVDGNNARTVRETKSVVAAYRTGCNTCTPPTIQATNFTASSITDNSMTIGWTRGSGDAVLVVARPADISTRIPISETTYQASSIFGNGTQIGSENYVVYNGTGTFFNITSLYSGTAYNFDIYEYNSATHCYLKPALTGTAKTNGNLPGNSVTDSLALVALYNQCGGPNWTRKANWLTGPLSTWEGVTIENGRVVELNLGDDNNSVGLTGSIVPELSNLTKIRVLNLCNNQLVGILPESWSVFDNLQDLNLNNNQITGSLPESWATLKNLINLNLYYNQLTGILPKGWSTLVNLKRLILGANQITGTLPDNWSAFVNLQFLNLNHNLITGSLPASWKNMLNMVDFWIQNNELTGSLPESWSSLVNLRTIILEMNKLTGSLPESWSSLVNLKHIWLNVNQLSGALPESWSALNGLEVLFLGFNKLSGPLPESWSTLINLKTLELISNQLTGSLPESWSALKNLQFIQIAENKLTGTLPESWSALTNLGVLSISTNQFTGSLPESYSALTNIYFLSIAVNHLTGTLPESWSTLVKLQELFLYGNQISGTVPASWSACVKSDLIDISRNQLVGSVPDSWQSLVNLNRLAFSSNQISGMPDFSACKNLSVLHVGSNRLDFGDIEPNIGVAKDLFYYDGQAPVGEADTIIKNQNEELRISVTVDGKSNKYQWNKNGVNIAGATRDVYVVPSVTPKDAGIYICQITNTLATELMMTSQPITLQIISQLAANAGPDQSVYESSPVTLDGSSSSASEGKSLTYKWTAPQGITLNSTTIVKPTFTAPEVNSETAYTFFLVVNDGGIDSPADQVVITVKDFNNRPIANAGMDKSECEGMIASLDGSASLDQYGKTLTYQWTVPVGIVLSSTSTSNPTFTAPEVSANTNFTFSLVVNNGNVDSPADEILITVLKCSNPRQQDSLALVALYKSTDGPNWIRKNNWLTGTLNFWGGVVMNNGRVNYLTLGDNGLKGPLPSELSSLSEIYGISLSNNKLTGTLPPCWSKLAKLHWLYLESNQLTGSLPDSWSDLVNLELLYLGCNQLSGSLPNSWPAKLNLQELSLYNNKISELPVFSSLTNLNSLMVQGNMLDFADIEPNIGVPKSYFSYSPQASVGLADTIVKNQGEEFRISIAVEGKSNNYQWYNNTGLITSPFGTWYNNRELITGATGTEFVIPSVSSVDAGDYTCQITNTVATELTLQSQPITLQISIQAYTQNIPLIAGWNIISSNVVPSITNLKDMVQPLIDGGKLNKVMDESGKMIEDFGAFGGWQNGIGAFSQTEGYKVNMMGTDALVLQGKAVKLPFSISLSIGWNIVSYPCANAQSALTMVQPLIDAGKLNKVMDESGKVIEDFGAYGGWKNNIGDFKAGKGYKIKVSQLGTLTINSSELRSATKVPTVLPSVYFTKAFIGNGTDHMNIHLVDLAASSLQIGDEIGIFDGKVCVGSAAIAEDQVSEGSISIPASCNDALGGTVNGYIPGHPVEIRLYREGETFDLTLEKLRGSATFEKDGSLFAKISSKQPTNVSNTDGSILFLCHPNPFAEEIQIDVRNIASTKLSVDIYNLFGQKIKMLYQGANTGLLHLKWNGTNDKGNRIVAGVYLCRVNDQSKKIVFIGGK